MNWFGVWFCILLTVLPLPCDAVDRTENTEPVVLYDLTPLRSVNLNDRDDVIRVWEECHAIATLQGIVNRDEPRLYLEWVEWAGQNIDRVWLERLRKPGAWLNAARFERVTSFEALVERFRSLITGVVLYDPNVASTSNVASTIAGIENCIAVRFNPKSGSVYDRLVQNGPRLPVVVSLLHEDGSSLFTGQGTIPDTARASTGSAKCDAYLWAKEKYLDTGRCDGGYAAYYIDQYWIEKPQQTIIDHHTLSNHDFFVSKRAFFFDLGIWADEVPVDDPHQRLGTDRETLKEIFRSCYDCGGKERMIHVGGFTPWAYKYTDHPGAGGKQGGVPTEWEMVRIGSAYNAFFDADAIDLGAMANASFYTHFPLKKKYSQKVYESQESLKQKGFLDENGHLKQDGRQYVVWYVGDYDSAAWLNRSVLNLWDHPSRGKVPMGWSISPIIARRAPHAMAYIWETATENDGFMAADNGAGYLNPGMLHEPRDESGLPCGLTAWINHSVPFFQRWDLSITGFVIDGYAPGMNEEGLKAYARFSPHGIVPQKVKGPAFLFERMPVLQAGPDINHGDPQKVAQAVLEAVNHRRQTIPFHWYRAILKDPGWYEAVVEHVRERDSSIVFLTPEPFFMLLQDWLESNSR